MKLKSTQIGDFRRFTDLAVQEIRATAQLIVLAGPNGRGNSASRSQASSASAGSGHEMPAAEAAVKIFEIVPRLTPRAAPILR